MEASNLQELKDAAIELMWFTCNSCEQRFCEEDTEEGVPSPCSAIIRMRNALSANPIRNCDVGTADEQTERFADYCCAKCDGADCKHGLWIEDTEHKCALKWAQMPYTERGDDGSK